MPPLPDLDGTDLPEITSLPWEQLKLVPHRKGKWLCCAEDCRRFTHVRDFGLFPKVYHGRHWRDISIRIYLCGRHYRPYVDALKRHDLSIFQMKSHEQLERERAGIFPKSGENLPKTAP